MPVKIVRRDHFELLGEGYVLLAAPHAAGPEADLQTGQIVEDAALTSRCYAVVGKVSPEYRDLNRVQAAQTELRKSIDAMIEENGIRCLLDIRGKKDAGVKMVELDGTTISPATIEFVRTRLSKNFAVTGLLESAGSRPENNFTVYSKEDVRGSSFEALQLQFGKRERELERELVVNSLVELVALLNQKLSSNCEAK